MATKKTVPAPTPNPTLHGLLVARSFSGTVVRGLLFVLLTAPLLAVVVADAKSIGGSYMAIALAIYAAIVVAYIAFEVAYIVMANIRPLHPRLDRIILPLALVFSLAVLYSPALFADAPNLYARIWPTGAIALLCVLAARFALLITSSKR